MQKLMMMLALTASFTVNAADIPGQKSEGSKAGGPTALPAVARAMGVVKGMDSNGRVIISHEAIPALQWPAMIMSFKISAELAKGLKDGQKVEFEFQPRDMDGTITKVKVLP
jgi:Cu(I)/Ag(I) efflux system protein CusF